MITKHILITGKVQGVFFRKYTKQHALKTNIKGWVKNLPDGRVEIMAQANEKDLSSFIDYCSRGPSNATVQQVHIIDLEAEPFNEFQILR